MIVSFLLSLVVAAVLVRILASGRLVRGVVDNPNERSLHFVPVPRTGGVGLFVALAVCWLAFSGSELLGLLALSGMLWALSLADDALDLPVKVRLSAHFLAAVTFLAIYFTGPFVVFAIALLTIVWMTNLFNFMDGSDGLAGGMAVFGFGAYAIAAMLAGESSLAAVSAAIVGAALGFLISNFPPARIFMGDAGSIPLGFLSATIGITGWQSGAWPFWFPGLVFSPFIVDASTTLAKRYMRGEKLSIAHRTHYYQRLVQMGLGHRGTALIAYALMLAVTGTAIAGREMSHWTVAVLLAFWAVVYVVLMRLVDVCWARHLLRR